MSIFLKLSKRQRGREIYIDNFVLSFGLVLGNFSSRLNHHLGNVASRHGEKGVREFMMTLG